MFSVTEIQFNADKIDSQIYQLYGFYKTTNIK